MKKNGPPPGGAGKRKRKGAYKGTPAGVQCTFVGVAANGKEMSCYNLNKRTGCKGIHSEEDLQQARTFLRGRTPPVVPTFNAFDASEFFETMTKAMETKVVADTGAKKSVCGQKWLSRYARALRQRTGKTVRTLALPRGQHARRPVQLE